MGIGGLRGRWFWRNPSRNPIFCPVVENGAWMNLRFVMANGWPGAYLHGIGHRQVQQSFIGAAPVDFICSIHLVNEQQLRVVPVS